MQSVHAAVSIFLLILTLVFAEKHLFLVYHIASRLARILGISYLLNYFDLYNAYKASLTDLALRTWTDVIKLYRNCGKGG